MRKAAGGRVCSDRRKAKIVYPTPEDGIEVVPSIDLIRDLARSATKSSGRASHSAAEDLDLDLTAKVITEGKTRRCQHNTRRESQ